MGYVWGDGWINRSVNSYFHPTSYPVNDLIVHIFVNNVSFNPPFNFDSLQEASFDGYSPRFCPVANWSIAPDPDLAAGMSQNGPPYPTWGPLADDWPFYGFWFDDATTLQHVVAVNFGGGLVTWLSGFRYSCIPLIELIPLLSG